MVKIRLRRMGAKKAPYYRVVEAASRYPRDAPAETTIDAERAREGTKTGAQPTATARALLKKADVL